MVSWTLYETYKTLLRVSLKGEGAEDLLGTMQVYGPVFEHGHGAPSWFSAGPLAPYGPRRDMASRIAAGLQAAHNCNQGTPVTVARVAKDTVAAGRHGYSGSDNVQHGRLSAPCRVKPGIKRQLGSPVHPGNDWMHRRGDMAYSVRLASPTRSKPSFLKSW